MGNSKQLQYETVKPARYLVPRIVTGIAGSALLYYGWRKRNGIIGGLASSAGLSLIARSIDQPMLLRAIKNRTGIFARPRPSN